MRIQRILIYLGGGFILFRKFRTKRQIQEFKEHADPALLAEEIEALKRENAEAPSADGPLTPTSIGTEIFPRYRKFFSVVRTYGIPILNPRESSWNANGIIEPENFDNPKD